MQFDTELSEQWVLYERRTSDKIHVQKWKEESERMTCDQVPEGQSRGLGTDDSEQWVLHIIIWKISNTFHYESESRKVKGCHKTEL